MSDEEMEELECCFQCGATELIEVSDERQSIRICAECGAE